MEGHPSGASHTDTAPPANGTRGSAGSWAGSADTTHCEHHWMVLASFLRAVLGSPIIEPSSTAPGRMGGSYYFATFSSFSTLPSRTWIMRWAYIAISCSWVTSTMVLPC